MANSPKLETFVVFKPAINLPWPGHTGMAFTTYITDLGVPVAQPSIVEIGGGMYGFTPVFASAVRGISYILDTNGANPTYFSRYMRPEDWNADNADLLTSTVKTAVGGVQSTVTTIDGKVDTVISDVSDVQTTADSIEGKVDTAISDIGDVQTTANTIDGKVDTANGLLAHLRRLQEGRWKVHTSGPYEDCLVLYAANGTDVLQYWSLLDSTGAATAINPFERVPNIAIP